MEAVLKRPKIKLGSHPIATNDYLADTLSINNQGEKIFNWASEKIPGVIVYGKQRLGKTCAIKYLRKQLETNESLDVSVFSFKAFYSQKINENEFFTMLGRDIGLELYDKGKAIDKRIRIQNALKYAGINSSRKHVLLFIDEAQRLQPQHYNWLMDLFNELDEFDIKLTTILVGQEELKHRKNSFLNASQAQIVFRFMVHVCQYHGINSIESLWYLLNEFDEGLEFPIDSGWSYSRYYFPVGFANGWRMASEENVNILWNLLCEVHGKFGLEVEVPMFYMTKFINQAFLRFGRDGDSLEFIDREQWREIIFDEDYQFYLETYKSRK